MADVMLDEVEISVTGDSTGKVTMPPIMTESRNFREEVYPSSISLLKEITLSSLSGMSCPIRSCVLRRASEERLWYRMTICWAAPFV